MKYIFLYLLILGVFACSQSSDKTELLQHRIDSLETKLADTYKPGLGEFMSGLQVHHAKLWFAGTNENWPLANFEIEEMQEAITDIQKYETERKEAKLISMIAPALDSVNTAIQQKNAAVFKSSFVFLTKTCNSCHQAASHEFNVIKIPDTPPFSNQDFTLHTN